MNIVRNAGLMAVVAAAALAAGCGKCAKNTRGEEANNCTSDSNLAKVAEEAAPVAENAVPAEEEAAEEAVMFDDGETLVEAYGKSLTYGEAVSNIRRAMKMQGVPDGQLDAAVKQVAPMALPQLSEEFVMMAALQDAAAKCGVTCSDEDVEAEFAEATSRLPPGVTLEEALERSGITADELKKQIRESLPIKKMVEILTQGVEVLDDEIAKFYEENGESFETPEQVRASHILVKVESGASDEDKAAAKAKIEGLLAQVKDGADFAELAKANSDCPSKDKGGDLGFFGHGQMVPEFDAAAFALAEDGISDIVETQFGFHIIKKTGAKEAGKTPLDEVKDEIKSHIENQKKGDIVGKYMKGLRAGLIYTANEKLGPILTPEVEEQEEQEEKTPAPCACADCKTPDCDKADCSCEPSAEAPAAPETAE